MRMEILPFGRTSEGTEIQKVAFHGSHGNSAAFITYGATIQSLVVPDVCNRLSDVVLGFDSVAQYEAQSWRCGALIGRTCGRIRNGQVNIDGRTFNLSVNQGDHHLHGGFKGFDRKTWHIESVSNNHVKMGCESMTGEEGYPGSMHMSVTYRFSEDSELIVEYEAEADSDTICNPTNHVYFNLTGHNRNSINGHEMKIASRRIAERDEEGVLIGTIRPVENCKDDFRSWRRIDNGFGELEIESACYVLDGEGYLHNACSIREPQSGRQLQVSTSSSTLLFYGGKFIRGNELGKDRVIYTSHGGFCLETMELIGSADYGDRSILRVGEVYRQETRFAFSIMNGSRISHDSNLD